MQIFNIRPHQKYPKIKGAVIALGSFDGVHRGHQKILQTAKILANKSERLAGVITYLPIPQVLLHKDFHFLLTTDKEKIKVFKALSVDFLGAIKFTSHLKNLDAKQYFIEYIIKPIKPSGVVVGIDHRFGKEHKGNVALLKMLGQEFNFRVKVVSSLKYHNAPIKSTRVRELIILGNIKRANELLGRPYSIAGKVIKGMGLAKQLGFPTLNLHIPEKEKLVPADGVYHIRAYFERHENLPQRHRDTEKNPVNPVKEIYDGVMNIGFAPTIPDKFRAYQMRSLEVHLFNFSGTEQTALGKEITVEFFDRLRPEKKFDSLDELKKQIAEDVKKRFVKNP